MGDFFKIFFVAAVTSVASQLLLTPYIIRLQGLEPGVGAFGTPPALTPSLQRSEAPASEAGTKLAAPNLEGMTVDAAQDRWRDRGLVIIEDGERSASGAAPGTIIQQRPMPGVELSSKEIRVIVAKAAAHVEVPEVEGLGELEARAALSALGFEIPEAKREPSTQPQGTVLRQIPKAGTAAGTGSVVRLVVAEAASIEVPKLRGQYLSKAKNELQTAGLQLGKVHRITDHEHDVDYILRQEPAAGEKVPPDTAVDLFVVAPY